MSSSPERPSRVIDVIGAFSLAADMALGLTAGHGLRAAYVGVQLADAARMATPNSHDTFGYPADCALTYLECGGEGDPRH